VHHLQGEAAGVNGHDGRQGQAGDLKDVLVRFAAERLALIERHEAGARVVSHYDFNNTYQYIIAREDTHLSWLGHALADLGQPLPSASTVPPVPAIGKVGKKVDPGVFRPVLADDASLLSAFVERWQAPVNAVTNARHRTMLTVVLGETREHQRLFEQAAAGMEDVLGKRTGGVARQGAVLPVRWME
jgi:hypothetical protein